MPSPQDVAIQYSLDMSTLRPDETGVLTICLADSGQVEAHQVGACPLLHLEAYHRVTYGEILVVVRFAKTS
jgi:hypothetical protein